jgi:16S rRNA C967 or C1407 C5-methylase (RsmB/RsmF family)/NOL1/NOP2/fmu family ribosome biogenesis protein
MLPEAFVNRIKSQDYIDEESLLDSLAANGPISIRTNDKKMKLLPADSERVPWCSNGFYLHERPAFALDPLFHAGCYYPQEASGMFIGTLFSQLAGGISNIRVLDLCGAPGGKSTHLSSLIDSDGLLVSNEVIRSRVMTLSSNLTRWGLSNVMVTQNDPADFSRLKGFFDIILIDAPCSGEGMFRERIAVREWTEENAFHCSRRQRRILMDAWPALKEGGKLIYSTCTFNPDENEKNIKWFTGKVDAESLTPDISGYKGIVEIVHDGIRGYGFFPGKIAGDGFFVSVLQKTGKQDPLVLRNRASDLFRVTNEEKRVVSDWTSFQVSNIMKPAGAIISSAAEIDDYKVLSSFLRIVKHGTIICNVKNRDLLPHHELAMSVRLKARSFPSVALNRGQALAYLKREKFTVDDPPQGWFLVTHEGINLGFMNNVGRRLNNYYPVEWRVRANDEPSAALPRWIRVQDGD